MQYIFVLTSALKILSIVLPVTLISWLSRSTNSQLQDNSASSFLFLILIPVFFSLMLNYSAFKLQNRYNS